MTYFCNKCGVELDSDMKFCPLCGNHNKELSEEKLPDSDSQEQQPLLNTGKVMNQTQKKIVWEIISVVSFSFLLVTISIDYILNRNITWSEYPVAISFIVFSYVSLFAFMNQKTIVKIAGGFVLSSFFIYLVDMLTAGVQWVVSLGIPLLLSANVFAMLFMIVSHLVKKKGLNLIAYSFILLALYSVCIDGIISLHKTGNILLHWSVIVLACVLPVSFVLLFMHYRFGKNRDLERIFHI